VTIEEAGETSEERKTEIKNAMNSELVHLKS
jgi:hypothetical protein